MHSETDKIFVCGQFFPAKQKIEFMISDIGIGIKKAINNRFNSNLSGVQAISWAIKEGNTTKKGITGGIGLSLLYKFIKLNHGKVQIVSNDGFWQLDNGVVNKESFSEEFPGTMVNISVLTNDTASYRLKSEVPDNPF